MLAVANKLTVADLPDSTIRGKRALVRVDFNVPLDEHRRVSDDTRIRAALPTLEYLAEHGARVIVLSHLGRPKGKPELKYSLEPVSRHLAGLTKRRVRFVETTDTDEAMKATLSLPEGEILLLENTRYLGGEESNDERLARALARLGDFYVNDAFGAAHRAHASTEGVAHHLKPAVAGFLMEKELRYLGRALADPERPFVAVLGGAKISGKIDVIEQLLPKVDRLLIGGAMACTFFRAMGLETGKSLVEDDRVSMAKDLLARGGDKLVLPSDAVVAPSMEGGGQARTVARDAIPADQAMLDIGPRSVEAFAQEITAAKTVIWNGPMGVFETKPFDEGTRRIAEAAAAATDRGATTIVGGGDSAAAVAQMGLEDRMSHVSTGGGASLEFLEGKTLPGVAVLDDARG
ncbi:MAG TPA: phosphoglycerate kinase [Gemmatimonadaceae bacterium]|nr:phosphoglycerate kinase [Gemmatimonadaceae bacterium]